MRGHLDVIEIYSSGFSWANNNWFSQIIYQENICHSEKIFTNHILGFTVRLNLFLLFSIMNPWRIWIFVRATKIRVRESTYFVYFPDRASWEKKLRASPVDVLEKNDDCQQVFVYERELGSSCCRFSSTFCRPITQILGAGGKLFPHVLQTSSGPHTNVHNTSYRCPTDFIEKVSLK